MVHVEVDKTRNLLKLDFTGRVGPNETRDSTEQVAVVLGELEPGFRLLTDLSYLEAMDLGCEADIDRTMDLCSRRGVSTVVRVIPDPQKDIGLNIMSRFHYPRGVRIVTCETLSQALQALAD